jgi:hypothetical protein
MEVGKRYCVTWTDACALGSFRVMTGTYLGPSERTDGARVVGWPEFEMFRFDAKAGGETSIRREHIQHFTTCSECSEPAKETD